MELEISEQLKYFISCDSSNDKVRRDKQSYLQNMAQCKDKYQHHTKFLYFPAQQ